jgi:hypothetical protein
MTDYLQKWFEWKSTQGFYYLDKPATATETYHVHTGPRIIFGQVTLVATPAEAFSFRSEVTWPDRPDLHNDFVLYGVLDRLLCSTYRPILGVAVILTAFGWHEIDSVPIGYYYAARGTTRTLIGQQPGFPNITNITTTFPQDR